MPTTGKVTSKKYKCQTCGHELFASTNHWGEFYDYCPKCHWKHPMETQVFTCLEPMLEGYSKPEPWRLTRLGDILKKKRSK